jgi:HD-GYP domain-containing protein (c-di-GMP phosphodiesterase class II)
LKFAPRVLLDQDYNYHNAVLSALTSYKIAQWCGYPQKDWMQAAFAGLLHDIGNIKVDEALLQKPTPLTGEEVEEVRRHTTYGYQLLRNVTAINEGVRLAALQHHEKIDGSGYPLKLDGSQIHFYAKIVAVADIFHAMTLEKAYRRAQSPYLVLEQILTESFGKLDPVIVQTFIQKTTDLYNGTRIRLSDGRHGEIIFTDRSNPTRPMVQVEGKIVNLVQERDLYIEEIIA